MIRFKLPLNRKNREILDVIKTRYGCEFKVEDDEISVFSNYGLDISRMDLVLSGIELTEDEWRQLYKQVKRTIRGGRAQLTNPALISISLAKTELLLVRLTPLDKKLIAEAAKLGGESIAAFARNAMLKAAKETFEKETAEKMTEKTEKESKDRQKIERSYLA